VHGFTGYKDLSSNWIRFELQQRGRTAAVRGLKVIFRNDLFFALNIQSKA